MKHLILISLITLTGLSAGACFAYEMVYDPTADQNTKKVITSLTMLQTEQIGLKAKTESIEKAADKTMKYSEKVKEYTGVVADCAERIDKNIDRVQSWLGDAKKWTIDKIEHLTGIEDLEANCTEIANETIEIGKTLYGVYNVGKNVYDTSYNAYESFANMDASIDSIRGNMELLSSARQDIMSEIKTLSYKQSAASCLNQIQKNQSAYSAAQLKMQSLQAQQTEQTNTILLQNQAHRNAEMRYQQVLYDNYQNARQEMWKQYYQNQPGYEAETAENQFDFIK